jgi:hypothetical protein
LGGDLYDPFSSGARTIKSPPCQHPAINYKKSRRQKNFREIKTVSRSQKPLWAPNSRLHHPLIARLMIITAQRQRQEVLLTRSAVTTGDMAAMRHLSAITEECTKATLETDP